MANKNITWDDVKGIYSDNPETVADGLNFIEVYENALSTDCCARLVEKFEDYDSRGLTRSGTSGHCVEK